MARLVEVVWWWGVAVGVWVLTLSSATLPELVVAAGCGLPCAVAARAGRLTVGGGWRPRWRWLAWLVPLPVAVVADAVRVLAAAVRHLGSDRPAGELREIALPAGEPDQVAAARQALMTLTLSSTPGTFVVDADPKAGRLVVHSLTEGRPRMEDVVRR